MAINVKQDGLLLEGDAVCDFLVALWLERAGVFLVAQHNVDDGLEPILAVGGLSDDEAVPTSEHQIEEDRVTYSWAT